MATSVDPFPRQIHTMSGWSRGERSSAPRAHEAPPLQGANEGAVRGGMAKSCSMSVLNSNLMAVSEAAEAEHTRTGKLGGGAAVETTNNGDGYTTLEVTCGDKLGLMHKVSSVVTSNGLTIARASIRTDKVSKIATESFKLIVTATRQPLEQCRHEALQDVVVRAIEGHTGVTVSGGSSVPGLLKRSSSEGWSASGGADSPPLSVMLRSCSFGTENGHTMIHLVCDTRPGLLRDISSELLKLRIDVISVELQCNSSYTTSTYAIGVADVTGAPLSPLLMALVSNALRGEEPVEAESPSAAPVHSVLGTSAGSKGHVGTEHHTASSGMAAAGRHLTVPMAVSFCLGLLSGIALALRLQRRG